MAAKSLAYKKAQAKHWIKTYERRIAELKSASKPKKRSVRDKYRLAVMRDKIEHWKRMIKTWEEKEVAKLPATSILYFCEKYFTKEQFQLGYMNRQSRMTAICFSKFCCDNGYSNKEMWEAVKLHKQTFTDRRRKYNGATMGTFYRNFKNYMNDCISKEQQIRKDRKNKIANREGSACQGNKADIQAVRSTVLQHEPSFLY